MTNSIQSLTSLAILSNNNVITSKQSNLLSNTSFNEVFATLLSDINSASVNSEYDHTSNELMTSIIMMMFNNILGSETSADKIDESPPHGNPVNGAVTQTSHEGHVALDFGIPVGTYVKTTMEGKVTFAGWNNEGYGNLVIVENGAYKTYYAHLSNIPVSVGQSVNNGDVIGLSGNTGNSTGPHLHYEVRKNGVAINPLVTLSD